MKAREDFGGAALNDDDIVTKASRPTLHGPETYFTSVELVAIVAVTAAASGLG
jgi:hypothetical protein